MNSYRWGQSLVGVRALAAVHYFMTLCLNMSKKLLHHLILKNLKFLGLLSSIIFEFFLYLDIFTIKPIWMGFIHGMVFDIRAA